ncbi:MAG: hypothetical protein HFI71_08025 [Lachnospiraceae bacterium]|nr:hypothetical protein [Lachnospiraceae bacterium]
MNKIKKIAVSLCFVLIFCIVLNASATVFERKNSAHNYSDFWEQPEEYDIWFMGTSHVFYAIQPMELWNQYGIRAFDLAAPSSQMPQTYWTMMCALQYSQPRVIVLDTYKLHIDVKHQQDRVPHSGMDRIPFSITKVKGICDIFETWEERFEYLCKFSIYHNRWEELKESDFIINRSITKGARFKNKMIDRSDYQQIPKEDMSDTNTVGFQYLKKIIEECQRRKIELILIDLPFCSDKKQQQAINATSKIAEEYHVTFLNLAYEEGLIDYKVDFGDESHVNLFGAKKLTQYIGDYLSRKYDLMDYRELSEIAEKWNHEWKQYSKLKLQKMRKSQKIKRYIQWLTDDSYVCYMYQKRKPKEQLAKGLAQLKNITYISRQQMEQKMGAKIRGEFVFFVEDKNGGLLDIAVFEKGERQ